MSTNNDPTRLSFVESIHVEEWYWESGHAYYRLSLKLSSLPTTRVFYRRYSEFVPIDKVVCTLFSEYSFDTIPRFPHSRSSFSLSSLLGQGKPDDALLDKRCRELDWYMQQILLYFGGKHEGFWNAPEVLEFFSDSHNSDKTARLVGQNSGNVDSTNGGSFTMSSNPRKVDWSEWKKNVSRAEELRQLLQKKYSSTGLVEKLADRHYERMGEEFCHIVDSLHTQLQLHAGDEGTEDRWKLLEPLIDYKEKNIESLAAKVDKRTNTYIQPPKAHKEEQQKYQQRCDNLSESLHMQEKQLEFISESVERLKSVARATEKETKEQNELTDDLAKVISASQMRTEAATGRVNKLP